MSDATSTSVTGLPPLLRQSLSGIAWRARWVGALGGVGLLAAVSATGILTGVAADLLLVLPGWVRWGFWGLFVAAVSAGLLLGVFWPLLRRYRGLDLAAAAEKHQQGFQERLTATVALVQAKDRAHGSPALIGAIVEQAEENSKDVDPARVVPSGRAWRRFLAGAAAAVLVLAPASLWPDAGIPLLKRFLMPWTNQERIGRYIITIRGGDRMIAQGDDLKVVADIQPRFGAAPCPNTALLRWWDSKGQIHQASMVVDPQRNSPIRTWRLTLPQVSETIRLSAHCGTAASKVMTITALAPPAVQALSVLVQPPPYTNQKPYLAPDPARVDAWQDSLITLSVQATSPLRFAQVTWPDEPNPSSLAPAGAENSPVPEPEPNTINLELKPDGNAWTGQARATVTGTFQIAMTDQYGLSSRPEPARRVVVKPDRPPTVAWTEGADHEESAPGDILATGLLARDDLAVAAAELHYVIRRAGSEAAEDSAQSPIQLRGFGTARAGGTASLDLSALGLMPGDELAYRARVLDNRPAPRGPNEAWTAIRTLSIVAKADPLVARRSSVELKRLIDMLTTIKKNTAETRQASEQLRYAADAVSRGNGTWDQSRQGNLQEQEEAARGEIIAPLHELAKEFSKVGQLARLAEDTEQIAEVEAEAAREALAQGLRSEADPERLKNLRQADQRLAAVQARLDELQKDLERQAAQAVARQRLSLMAERQETLADQAGDLARGGAPERALLDQLQAEQSRLNKELDEHLQKSPELKAELLAARAQEADHLAELARALAERQREASRNTGDLADQRDSLQALIRAQQELEADARRLALDVDTPLAENDRARLNIQAVGQPAEPLERGDADQARLRLEDAEGELRRVQRDLEDLPNDPRSLAKRLLKRQEELRERTAQALKQSVGDRNNPSVAEKQALAQKLGPLLAEQKAIADLAKAVPAPREQPDLKPQAEQALGRAIEVMEQAQPSELEGRQNDARDSLRRLAQAMPDPSRQRNEVRQRIAETRRAMDQIGRDLERHLRETAPQAGKAFDARKAAADLAERLAPLAQKEAEAAADLDSLPMETRLRSQRDLAVTRARNLAQALAGAKKDALPTLLQDARAALERLDSKFQGRLPADELAQELAGELRALGDPDKPVGEQEIAPAADALRLATALQAIDAPDGMLLKEQAAQAAAEAARILAEPPPQGQGGENAARDALQAAAQAADALARRLTDRLTPPEHLTSLAQVEKAMSRPEADRNLNDLAARQTALAGELAAVEALEPSVRELPAAAEARQAVALAQALTAQAAQPPGRVPDGSPVSTPRTAAAARVEAAQALENLAVALPAQEAEHAAQPEEPAATAREQTSQLSTKQRELADQLQKLQEEADKEPNKLLARARLAEQVKPLTTAQRSLREQARAQQDPRPSSHPDRREAQRRQDAAAVLQERVLEALNRSEPGRAAALAREAGDQLNALATALPEKAPEADPSAAPLPADSELAVGSEEANAANELAKRERRIRERLQALLAQQAQQPLDMRQEAVALAQPMADLKTNLQSLGSQAQTPAGEAAELLGAQAPRTLEETASHLQRAQPSSARETSRRAAELLERAAQRAEDAASTLRAEAGDTPPHNPSAEALAAAQAAQDDVAQNLAQIRGDEQGAQATASAEAAMREAAQQLRTASQPPSGDAASMAMNAQPADASPPGNPQTTPDQTNPTPESAPAGVADADLTELQALVKSQTGRAWGELPGHLRTELLELAQGRYRADYARLIQLYFRQIASGGETR